MATAEECISQCGVFCFIQVSFMPILVLAARLCPPGVEATLFATLMSIYNGGTMTGGLLGAGLTKLLGVTAWNFHNLALLLVICNVSSLLPLPFLGLLPSEAQLEAAVEKAEKTLGNNLEPSIPDTINIVFTSC
jgi:hypothetical protein